MKKQPEATPIKTLRDAYKVRGFRVLAKLYMTFRRSHSPTVTAAKAGFSAAAAYRFEKSPGLPRKRRCRASGGGSIRWLASGMAKSSRC